MNVNRSLYGLNSGDMSDLLLAAPRDKYLGKKLDFAQKLYAGAAVISSIAIGVLLESKILSASFAALSVLSLKGYVITHILAKGVAIGLAVGVGLTAILVAGVFFIVIGMPLFINNIHKRHAFLIKENSFIPKHVNHLNKDEICRLLKSDSSMKKEWLELSNLTQFFMIKELLTSHEFEAFVEKINTPLFRIWKNIVKNNKDLKEAPILDLLPLFYNSKDLTSDIRNDLDALALNNFQKIMYHPVLSEVINNSLVFSKNFIYFDFQKLSLEAREFVLVSNILHFNEEIDSTDCFSEVEFDSLKSEFDFIRSKFPKFCSDPINLVFLSKELGKKHGKGKNLLFIEPISEQGKKIELCKIKVDQFGEYEIDKNIIKKINEGNQIAPLETMRDGYEIDLSGEPLPMPFTLDVKKENFDLFFKFLNLNQDGEFFALTREMLSELLLISDYFQVDSYCMLFNTALTSFIKEGKKPSEAWLMPFEVSEYHKVVNDPIRKNELDMLNEIRRSEVAKFAQSSYKLQPLPREHNSLDSLALPLKAHVTFIRMVASLIFPKGLEKVVPLGV